MCIETSGSESKISYDNIKTLTFSVKVKDHFISVLLIEREHAHSKIWAEMNQQKRKKRNEAPCRKKKRETTKN